MIASTLSVDPTEEMAALFGDTPCFFQLYTPSATVVFVVVADQKLGPRERATCVTPRPDDGENLWPTWMILETPHLCWLPPQENG
jgi:hypothetical protein